MLGPRSDRHVALISGGLLLFSLGQHRPCQAPSGGDSAQSPASCRSEAAKEARGAGCQAGMTSLVPVRGSRDRAVIFHYQGALSYDQAGARMSQTRDVIDAAPWHSPNSVRRIHICFHEIPSSVSLRELF